MVGTGRTMKIIGLAGWSGAGKTTLMVALLAQLTGWGLRVSTIKHAHHDFDIDKPGKDSFRHRQAGAQEVLIASGQRWALMHELRDEPEPSLPQLLSHLSPVDLVVIEGFKAHDHAKIEIHRPDHGKPPLWPADPHILAVASDQPLPQCPLPVLDLNDPAAIAQFIVTRLELVRP